MRFVIFVILLLILVGCGDFGEFYIGGLSRHDQNVFRQAARREHADVVKIPTKWITFVLYGNRILHKKKNGSTTLSFIILRQNPPPCSRGGRDQKFLVTARHEIRHTQGDNHSSNPEKLMHKETPCWPID